MIRSRPVSNGSSVSNRTTVRLSFLRQELSSLPGLLCVLGVAFGRLPR